MYSSVNEKTKNNMILKETRWFLMHANSHAELRPQFEEKITDVAWIPRSKLCQLKTYDSIKSVFNYFFHL